MPSLLASSRDILVAFVYYLFTTFMLWFLFLLAVVVLCRAAEDER